MLNWFKKNSIAVIAVSIAFAALVFQYVDRHSDLTAEFLEDTLAGVSEKGEHRGDKAAFYVWAKFNKEINTSYKHICKNTKFKNAKCEWAKRVHSDQNKLWLIKVMPESDFNVVLDFVVNRKCNDNGKVICTAEDEMLKQVQILCIPGKKQNCCG